MQKHFSPYILGFFIALGGALLARWLNSPLPWLIGPLLATAITSMLSAPTKSHDYFRRAGQWVIGTSLGLYFTPHTVQAVISYWPYIVLSLAFTLLLSGFNTAALYRWGQVDFKTAWFAGAVGGASEMANLAARYNARIDSVASSHSVRVLIVVMIIPFAYKFLDIHGNTQSPITLAYQFSYSGLALLIVLTLLAIYIFQKLNIPNAWVQAPLLVTLLLTSNEIHLTHLSPTIQSLGQLFIGWSLGSKYGPDFFRRAPRYLTVSALVSVAALVLSAGFAYLLFLMSDIPLSTLILSISPGGIAEMTITAKVLMLGVPIVTAFHVARMVFVIIVAQPCYKLLSPYFEK
ncbi:AbrB family transcriptional regulator [Pelistega suis]|uniref:AbrB family transcriptional regulator n=1 Tax=Pelistega suis TaxID=1631957 RepID=A0A849P825_9BURK|nr:AbrB family transcriptional regulator [Pelistega suis]NOL51922.1 AbrB family transcriptional regulator [Pelistega suis]